MYSFLFICFTISRVALSVISSLYGCVDLVSCIGFMFVVNKTVVRSKKVSQIAPSPLEVLLVRLSVHPASTVLSLFSVTPIYPT